MNAAETRASNATAACTPLAVVSRSRTTAEIDTFISDVSITNTNIAIASRMPRRGVPDADGEDTTRSIADATAPAAETTPVPPPALHPVCRHPRGSVPFVVAAGENTHRFLRRGGAPRR